MTERFIEIDGTFTVARFFSYSSVLVSDETLNQELDDDDLLEFEFELGDCE